MALCTTSPCADCVKLLLNTSCRRIIFVEEYPHRYARERWGGAGRVWQQLSDEDGRFVRYFSALQLRGHGV